MGFQHFPLVAPNGRGILSWMASLIEVITALRREIDAALAENLLPNSRIGLEPDRVVLSLDVAVREQRVPNGPVELSFEVLEANCRGGNKRGRLRVQKGTGEGVVGTVPWSRA